MKNLIKKFSSYCLICASIFLNAIPLCFAEESKQKELPLLPTEYQSKLYNIEDQNAVFNSIITILQEDGFTIQNTNNTTSMIIATKDISRNKTGKNLANIALMGLSVVVPVIGICALAQQLCCIKKKDLCGINANIKLSNTTNGLVIQANFQEKYKKWKKITLKDIDDVNCYHNFFGRLEQKITNATIKTSFCY